MIPAAHTDVTRSLPFATAVFASALLAGCASHSVPEAGLPSPTSAEQGFGGTRWAVEPVPTPPSFQAALDAGTRTDDGAPGPEYWTQAVDYRIEATLEPSTALLTGSETIRYENRSPDDISLIILHLYQNLFSEGVQRTRTVPTTGGVTVERVVLEGGEIERVQTPQRAAYLIDGTLMAVYLDAPLEAGGVTELEVDWTYTVPPAGAPRQGHIDHLLYNVAQWYPQVAVYDDLNGWHAWPYLGNGEFYLEYGDFDVSLTVPEGWLIGASGTLRNPEEVLTPTVRDRLAQARDTDDVVNVVNESERGAGSATLDSDNDLLTWRFQAEGVRDFAFATSSEYVWDATRTLSPDVDGDGSPEIVEVHSFFRPEVESWLESADYIRHAVSYHAERWHPYPWPQMTGAEGPVGGMEYPMLTFVAAFPEARTVYEVLNHEIGHMWYPMMVGSNEPSYPWMDEGLTTYIEDYATGDYWDDPEFWRNAASAYLAVAGLENETPIMRHADLHGPSGTYTQAAYMKPATLLRALEGVIGREAVWESLATYAERWIYGHPHPLDFFNTVESVAGRDLDWFWHPFWYETAYLDQAVTAVDVGGPDASVVRVTVADLGTAPMPIVLEIEFTGEETVRETVPVEVWLEGATEHVVEIAIPGGAEVEFVQLDPDHQFPDVDRDNDSWDGG